MSGRTGPRSRTGCSTCRTRKVKCDEEHPNCSRCRTAQLTCEWQKPVPRRPNRPLSLKRLAAADKAVALQQAARSRMLLPRDAFSLSTSQQLRNSLQLTSVDRECLAYFPNSVVVAWVGKPWKWGFLHYLYRTMAADSPVVMRLMLAISASELERRRGGRSSSGSRPALLTGTGNGSGAGAVVEAGTGTEHWAGKWPGAGLAHYGTALREFCVELNCSRQQLPLLRHKADEFITAFFFLVNYEKHFGRGWAGLSTHLAGLHAFLRACKLLGDDEDASDKADAIELAAPTKNLLLFIMYIALSCDWSDGGGNGNGESWLRAMGDTVFCDFLDQLFLDSRYTNSLVYSTSYPTEALADDISVYNALDFFHECSKLKYCLRSYVCDLERGRVPVRPPAYFLGELKRLGKRFRVLIMMAQREDPGVSLRELQAIYSVVSEYHALEILCHQYICLRKRGTATTSAAAATPACHHDAVASILGIGERLMQRNSRAMLRLVWPLTIAAQYADRPADRRWIRETVRTIQQDTGTSGWLAQVVDDIFAAHSLSQMPRVVSASTSVASPASSTSSTTSPAISVAMPAVAPP